ncbi:MAG: efflux RND transporter periplasmic adaptor subunit [Deltaproteobacteria bacterium]|nr:efflux RND transporter periplasmic adaptor subunit [Deltaproteobacteria bacterium]MCB9788470.1 efflux RND transporter periplasmic adaptor subunit [Deltaproteobacteria bacterium]
MPDRLTITRPAARFVAASLAAIALTACGEPPRGAHSSERMVPVEVAPIRRGAIEAHRTFSGTLEAFARFDVAPKIGGRVAEVRVDIGDTVAQGSVVVTLDDDEAEQALALAEARLKVARAAVAGASSTWKGTGRELERERRLQAGGVSSDAQLDAARTRRQVADADKQMARAEVSQAEAEREVAKIRLEYTKVRASWAEGDDERVVAARHVDPGDTVAANAPLLTIVERDPLVAVISVTERDYAELRVGQVATLTSEAAPGRSFPATVARVAPAFSERSRQARVELRVENAERLLAPGAFARVTVALERAEDALLVPEAALTRRHGEDGVFVVQDDLVAAWRPVRVGIRDQDLVQVEGEGLSGRVVTLGQQLLDEGVRVTIPEAAGTAVEAAPAGG